MLYYYYKARCDPAASLQGEHNRRAPRHDEGVCSTDARDALVWGAPAHRHTIVRILEREACK